MLSPELFNFYISDQPAVAELHPGFADNSHDAESAVDVGEAADRLTAAMSQLGRWVDSKSLFFALEKVKN